MRLLKLAKYIEGKYSKRFGLPPADEDIDWEKYEKAGELEQSEDETTVESIYNEI